LEFPASILYIKKYFRPNMRNKWHNIKIIFIEIIMSKWTSNIFYISLNRQSKH
jgi:hypothetical protein